MDSWNNYSIVNWGGLLKARSRTHLRFTWFKQNSNAKWWGTKLFCSKLLKGIYETRNDVTGKRWYMRVRSTTPEVDNLRGNFDSGVSHLSEKDFRDEYIMNLHLRNKNFPVIFGNLRIIYTKLSNSLYQYASFD